MKLFNVVLDDLVICRGCEIGDGVIQHLHFGQETVNIKIFTTGIVPEFNLGLFVGRVSKLTRPSFHQGSKCRQPHHGKTLFP